MSGKVRFYDLKRKYGFIDGDDRMSYFFHRSEIIGAIPEAGWRVTFDPAITEKGPRAVGVRKAEEKTEGRAS
jgi:cold shock CspA family protein